MAKDKRFSIRIKSADIEFYENNLPPEIESISELLRVGAKQLISGDSPISSKLDLSGIHEAINESRNKIIFEVQQNRALMVSLQDLMQSQKLIRVDKKKKAAINQLIEIWLTDPDLLRSYSKVEDLESSVVIEHLHEVALDAIRELSDRKYLSVSPGGKIKWTL